MALAEIGVFVAMDASVHDAVWIRMNNAGERWLLNHIIPVFCDVQQSSYLCLVFFYCFFLGDNVRQK